MNNINNIYEFNTCNIKDIEKSSDLYKARENFTETITNIQEYKSDVTVYIQAYNRLEKTKQCVESVLKYTSDVDYDLILVDNGSNDGTFDYFKSVKHDKCRIIKLTRNIGSAFPLTFIRREWISKYFVAVANDLIMTKGWLSNLIKVAESDKKIGMVNPVSSNVSNMQQIDLDFIDYNDMQEKAAEYNISDPSKWHERIRLITLGTLFKKETLLTIGWPYSDVGFIHDFGDDDISFRVRRAGYKAILAKDTWIHHNHDFRNFEDKNPLEFENSLKKGMKNFQDKYFGIDAWQDTNNFVFPYISNDIDKISDCENVNILGIDVKCGTPILDVKNEIRKYEIYNPKLSAYTTDGRYHIDLSTICNNKVITDKIDYLRSNFEDNYFDYIIIGEAINSYNDAFKVIKDAFMLLKMGGQLFIRLENTYNAGTFIKMLGYNGISNEILHHIYVEDFIIKLREEGIDIRISAIQPENVSEEVIEFMYQVVDFAKSRVQNSKMLVNKLLANSYWFKICR